MIFYVTGQKIRYKIALPRQGTGLRSQKKKDKAVSFRKLSRKKSQAVSVGSRTIETKPHTKLVLVSRKPLLYLEYNKPNKKNDSEINLLKKIQLFCVRITVDTLIDVRNETSKHHFLKSVK